MTVVPTPLWRRILRSVLWALGNVLIRMFTRSTISGTENFPKRGPYIIAGNHRGIMEAFLMLAACPHEVEVLGAGDIPLDRRYRYFAWLYGFIPYNRGQMDRAALKKAVNVLEHGGIVGIFPEGGIWQAARKSAHRGVSWLSFSAHVPVVPIGFGGVFRAVERAAQLEMPRVESRVGKPIPVPPRGTSVTRKEQMESHSEAVMDQIEELIPNWDRREHQVPLWDQYSLGITIGKKAGQREIVPVLDLDCDFPEAPVVAKLFYLPVLIDTLYFNLNRRDVGPLRHPIRFQTVSSVLRAIRVAVGYGIRTSPIYYGYRLGDETAEALMAGLTRIAGLLNPYAEDKKAMVRFEPVQVYQLPGMEQPVRLTRPPKGGNV